MVKWLLKILLITISISFFISAAELNIGEAQNTFFDEYDTYVKTEQVSLDHTISAQQENDTYVLINYILDQYSALKDQTESVKHPHLAYFNHYPPKLFLCNSVWRI